LAAHPAAFLASSKKAFTVSLNGICSRNGVGQVKLALLEQHDHSGRGDRLTLGGDAENCVGPHRLFRFHVDADTSLRGSVGGPFGYAQHRMNGDIQMIDAPYPETLPRVRCCDFRAAAALQEKTW
jgi:hypothetical protein